MDDFTFYLNLTKPLVLDLPSAKDRAMAALWLKKVREVNSSSPPDDLHVEYLKLLLVTMQENELAGVFENAPPPGDLHDLVPGVKKAQEILHLTRTEKSTAQGDKSTTRAYPPVVTSIGGDLCEYVAVQEIPSFGIHGYYALSTEPLSKWANSRPAVCADKTAKGNEESAKNATSGLEIGEITKKHERTKHSEKSLRKIFQAQRSEIAGVETRPCWGRSRYIDRLIDESPHLVGDLDLSEADALLHHYRDTKFRRKKDSSAGSESKKACAISSRRRRVETRLDMPPCAFVPEDNDYSRYEPRPETLGPRTCDPRNLDLNEARIAGEDDEVYDEYDEDYCPCVHFAPTHGQGHETRSRDYPRPVDDQDDQCESELVETTDYDTWQNYARVRNENGSEPSGSMDEPFPYVDDSTMGRVDSDTLDDVRRLVADPYRREPPSRGKVKAPRRKPHPTLPPEEGTIAHVEAWDPPGHSTRIRH